MYSYYYVSCFNNQLYNLQLLCPNCHTLTENYRGKNKKHNNKNTCATCGIKIQKNSKQCTKCLGWYPKTTDYFYENKTNKTDGLFPYCKKCSGEKAQNWQDENIDRSILPEMGIEFITEKLEKRFWSKADIQGENDC